MRCKGFFIALTDPHTGSAFELQLVRRGIPPKALKRGEPEMARSKNRVLDVGQKDYGRLITAQVELENGEVVIANYKRFCWVRLPEELKPFYNSAMSQPPIGQYGSRSSQKSI